MKTPDEHFVSAVDRVAVTNALADAVVRAYPSRSQSDCYAAARAVVDRGDCYRGLDGRLTFTAAGRRALPTVAPIDRRDQSAEAKCDRSRALENALLGILPTDEK
jgi:hypothetical protein